MDNPCILETANGEARVDQYVALKLDKVPQNSVVNAYCLEETPCVLSIGRRAVEEHVGFHWEPGAEKPFWYWDTKVKKQGRSVKKRFNTIIPTSMTPDYHYQTKMMQDHMFTHVIPPWFRPQAHSRQPGEEKV